MLKKVQVNQGRVLYWLEEADMPCPIYLSVAAIPCFLQKLLEGVAISEEFQVLPFNNTVPLISYCAILNIIVTPFQWPPYHHLPSCMTLIHTLHKTFTLYGGTGGSRTSQKGCSAMEDAHCSHHYVYTRSFALFLFYNYVLLDS